MVLLTIINKPCFMWILLFTLHFINKTALRYGTILICLLNPQPNFYTKSEEDSKAAARLDSNTLNKIFYFEEIRCTYFPGKTDFLTKFYINVYECKWILNSVHEITLDNFIQNNTIHVSNLQQSRKSLFISIRLNKKYK